MNNKEIGKLGEDLAAEYLQKEGYIILERNVHFSRACEIDIIAKHKNTLVFVEVKTRTTTSFGYPTEAITKTKYQNLKTGLFTYLKENNIQKLAFRIDVISIILKPKLSIEHLKNISL